jgi:hypothetical protein
MDVNDLAIKLDALIAKVDVLLAGAVPTEQRFFGIARAAPYADLSQKSIRRLLATGKLTALRPVRGRILIDKRELDTLILGANRRPRTGRGLTT